MLRMPVATLRVWERRYGVTQPVLSASGQRLYSADDVRRLVLLKQLTDLGHAIGSLAQLDMEQLQQIASTHASVLAARGTPRVRRRTRPHPRTPGAWRSSARRWPGGCNDPRCCDGCPGRCGCWARLPTRPRRPPPCRAHRSMRCCCTNRACTRAGWPPCKPWRRRSPRLPKAVLYRYAADSTCAALATAGTALLREPQNDTVLGQWLQGVLSAVPPASSAARDPAQPDAAVPPRRWDDAALADFAGLSSTIACECPRHVAELLMQLSHFEAYSAECRHRNAADAELHAYLQQVAATSRARFEAALEYVALHEGLILPP